MPAAMSTATAVPDPLSVTCLLYWGYWDNGKYNGNYYSIIGYILGLYWDNRQEIMDTIV